MRRVVPKKVAAVSLVEFMISFLIFAVLAVGVTVYFFLGRDDLKITTAASDALALHTDVAEEISKLADTALRVNGATRDAALWGGVEFQGIQNFIPDAGQPQFEELRIYSVRFPNLTASVDGLTGNVLRLDPMTGDTYQVIDKYLSDTAGQFVALIGDRTTNIVKLRVQGTCSEGIICSFEVVEPAPLGGLSSQIDSDTRLAMVERSRIQVTDIQLINSEPTGILTLTREFGDQLFEQRVLARGVRQFQIRFNYSNQHRPPSVNLVIPFEAQSTYNGSDYIQTPCSTPGFCCDPTTMTCVNSADIAQANLSFETLASLAAKKESADNPADPTRIETGSDGKNYFLRDSITSIHPKGFSLMTGSQGAQAISFQCSLPQNRCKPGCEDFFVGTNIFSPNWEGYGRYVGKDGNGDDDIYSSGTPGSSMPSHYCRAGTPYNTNDPDDFIPPDTPTGYDAVPNYNAGCMDPNTLDFSSGPGCVPNPNIQIEAAIRHFNVITWTYKHPIHFMTHNGIRGDPGILSQYKTGDYGNITYNKANYVRLMNAYLTHEFGSAGAPAEERWWEHIRCRLGRDSLSSNLRAIFFPSRTTQAAGGLVQPPGRPEFGPCFPNEGNCQERLAAPWEEVCLCDPNPPTGAWHANEVCNHHAEFNLDSGGQMQPICPNTWAGQSDWVEDPPSSGQFRKVYKVAASGGDFSGEPKGLPSVERAALCECLAQNYTEESGTRLQVPTFEGHGTSRWWDFRIEDLDPALNVTGTNSPFPDTYEPWAPGRFGGGIGSRSYHPTRFPNSAAVRSVNVLFRTLERDGSNPNIQTSTNFRCDQLFTGVFHACTRPLAPTHPERLTILNNLSSAGRLNSGVDADANGFDDKVERYAPFCTRECWDGDAWTGNQELVMGIRQLRRFITGVDMAQPVPQWCGGDIPGGQGGM